jgi:hypothetical protein
VVLMIENYRTGLIWEFMRRCLPVVRGLRRTGFTGGWLWRGRPLPPVAAGWRFTAATPFPSFRPIRPIQFVTRYLSVLCEAQRRISIRWHGLRFRGEQVRA